MGGAEQVVSKAILQSEPGAENMHVGVEIRNPMTSARPSWSKNDSKLVSILPGVHLLVVFGSLIELSRDDPDVVHDLTDDNKKLKVQFLKEVVSGTKSKPEVDKGFVEGTRCWSQTQSCGTSETLTSTEPQKGWICC